MSPDDPRVLVFFYGSYINLDVLREVDLKPEGVEVARLPGFDIQIRPLANLIPTDDRTVYGILAGATHAELDRLYTHAREVLGGVYRPQAVLAHTLLGRPVPALCYLASAEGGSPADAEYVERIVAPARRYGFPAWYIERLESFRP